MSKIKFINQEEANFLVDNYQKSDELDLYGLYLLSENAERYVAFDNSQGSCYVEEFKELAVAIAWLEGAFDTSEMAEVKENDLSTFTDNLVKMINGEQTVF